MLYRRAYKDNVLLLLLSNLVPQYLAICNMTLINDITTEQSFKYMELTDAEYRFPECVIMLGCHGLGYMLYSCNMGKGYA